MPLLEAFLDELTKIARTRAAVEARKALAQGDLGTAQHIAKGYGQLGLAPRYVKDVSGGGEEAGVDLMMGRRVGPTDTGEGLMARKLYKPDSSISRGAFTTDLLHEKQYMTDAARGLSPEAKGMVPAMYGFEQKGQGPLMRHVSYHEYVPGVQDLRKAMPGGSEQALSKVEEHVLNPMLQQGMRMHDTISARPDGSKGVNYGNVVHTQEGPKILDFLPHQEGSLDPAQRSSMYYKPTGSSSFGSDKDVNMKALRKEVFNPSTPVTRGGGLAAAGQSAGSAATAVPGAAKLTPPGLNAHMPTVRPGAGTAMATKVEGAAGKALGTAMHMPTVKPGRLGGLAASALGHL